jgi:hypothetical protein
VVALGIIPGCAAGIGRNVYDQPHRDYHRWNSGEERSYRAYLAEHHRDYHPFASVDSTQQNEYWDWRHGRPDADRKH